LGNVNEVAIEVGADKAELEACLINPMTLPQLRKDYFTAVDGEIRGTPTFFINGYKMEGAIPFEVWEKIIARLDIYEQD
jgi:predicted DsbA family dithiol-disulfide isomerase